MKLVPEHHSKEVRETSLLSNLEQLWESEMREGILLSYPEWHAQK